MGDTKSDLFNYDDSHRKRLTEKEKQEIVKAFEALRPKAIIPGVGKVILYGTCGPEASGSVGFKRLWDKAVKK